MKIFHRHRWRTPVVSSAFAAVLGFLGSAAPAQADIIYFFNNPGGFSPALNTHSIVDANVLYNDPSLTLTGNPVEGTTQGNLVVKFLSDENLIANGGQATIKAVDGAYDNLLIDLADATKYFRSISFNLDPSVAGEVTFTVVDQFGVNPPQVVSVPVQGLYFFGAISINGQEIDNVSFTSTGQIEEVKQVRVGFAKAEVTAPEPASMALLGLGFVAAGLARRRRNSSV
jgi:hypothetical protein